MTALMEQHEAHKARTSRLWGGTTPPSIPKTRPYSPRPIDVIARDLVTPKAPQQAAQDENVHAKKRRDWLFVNGIGWTGPDGEKAEVSTPASTRIIAEVAKEAGISVAELCGASRRRNLVLARHKLMWRLSKETSLSLPNIGRRMGGFDHTSVSHGIKRHQARIDAGEA